MVTLLMMSGITLLGVATIWLIEHANQRGVAGWRLLVPFGAGTYVREYWQDVRWFALARVLGVVCILSGVGITLARDPGLLTDPGKIWRDGNDGVMQGSTEAGMDEFLALKQQAGLVLRGDDKQKLAGKVHGKVFAYQRVELLDGVLEVREGTDFLPLLDVRILIDLDPAGLTERRSFYVQPTDRNPPEVYVSWQDKEGVLQTEIVKRGYSMELQLAPLDEYRLTGYLQLILPGQPSTFLSGNFVAMTNHLRYVGGNVDITYDDPDTLGYVARDYLQSLYQSGVVRSVVVDQVSMDLDAGKGAAVARVRLSNEQLEEHRLELQRDDMGWQVVSGSDRSTVLQAGVEAAPAKDDAAPVAKVPPPRHVSPEDLAGLTGNQVTLLFGDGSTETGIVRGVDHRGLQIEEQIAAGSAQFYRDPATIREVRLSGGQVLLLDVPAVTAVAAPAASDAPVPGTASATTGNPGTETVTADDAAAPAAEPAGLARYKPLLNKQVSITGTDGRVRQGMLSGVAAEQLTLTVPMGAGSVQFYYKPSELQSVMPLKN